LKRNYRLILQTKFETAIINGGNALEGWKRIVPHREHRIMVQKKPLMLEDLVKADYNAWGTENLA
jgi:hypothetical protein